MVDRTHSYSALGISSADPWLEWCCCGISLSGRTEVSNFGSNTLKANFRIVGSAPPDKPVAQQDGGRPSQQRSPCWCHGTFRWPISIVFIGVGFHLPVWATAEHFNFVIFVDGVLASERARCQWSRGSWKSCTHRLSATADWRTCNRPRCILQFARRVGLFGGDVGCIQQCPSGRPPAQARAQARLG